VPKWENIVVEYKTIGGNQVHMLKLNGLPCGNLGIFNIYAPNNPIDHCNLWEMMKVEIYSDSN
jgi:hypothetical protein